MLESPEYSFRYDCGVTQAGFSIKFEDKLRIVSALCQHFAFMPFSDEDRLQERQAANNCIFYTGLL